MTKRMGYTIYGTPTELHQLYEEGHCQDVIQVGKDHDWFDDFEEFLITYKRDQLIVVNVESIGLQLSQLEPLLERVVSEALSLHFIENPLESDEAYIALLLALAKTEKAIVSHRTLVGLKRAQENGIVGGRPSIDQPIIDRIIELHTKRKYNIREISAACNVSIGTVHKYLTLNKASHSSE